VPYLFYVITKKNSLNTKRKGSCYKL
jgi:hypothetical protein